MSYGPLAKCYKCKKELDINDPQNGGYCGGNYCIVEDLDRPIIDTFETIHRLEEEKKPKLVGNRKERRAAVAKARQKVKKNVRDTISYAPTRKKRRGQV
jgi:hypothetical protein